MDFSQFLTIQNENALEIKKTNNNNTTKTLEDVDKEINKEMNKEINKDVNKDVNKTRKKENSSSNERKQQTAFKINSMFKSKPSSVQYNNQPLDITEPEFKKGDFVKIVYMKDSILNNYKGYNGEIRNYVRNSDVAYVTLEAINGSQSIKFPVKHFI